MQDEWLAGIPKSELLVRIGDMDQVAGVRLATLEEGNEAGVRAAFFSTGTGFNFTVLLSRGMDISAADYQGKSLCWRSPSGDAHPAFFEPEGLGWLRNFFGGLVATCGLTYAGAPCVDQGQALGLHGRYSNTPAGNVCVEQEWQGDQYVMSVRGQMREACLFAENIRLTRRVWARLGENRFHIDDVVENLGYQTSEHMILYHVNGGYPAVDAGSLLLSPTRSTRPRDAEAEQNKENYCNFDPPTKDYKEKCYYHEMAAAPDGSVVTALANKKFNNGEGFGCYLRYNIRELPIFTEWKQMGQGYYVVGMEPANCHVQGRDKERAWGSLQFLEPGERREYHLELGVLPSGQEIGELEREIKALLGK